MSVPVFDAQGNQRLVDEEEAARGLAAGTYRPAHGYRYGVRLSDGRVGQVDAEEVNDVLRSGGGLVSEQDVATHRASQEAIRTPGSAILAGVLGAGEAELSGATQGVSAEAERLAGVDQAGMRARRQLAGPAGEGGVIAGALAPALLAPEADIAGGVGNIAEGGATQLLERLLPGAGENAAGRVVQAGARHLARGTAEGALFGVQQALDEDALGDRPLTADSLLTDVGTGAVLGGLTGTLLGAGGRLAREGTVAAAERLAPDLARAFNEGTLLRELAGRRAFAALGAGRRDVRGVLRARGLSGPADIGNVLIEQGIGTLPLGQMQEALEQQTPVAGQEIGQILGYIDQRAGARDVALDPYRGTPTEVDAPLSEYGPFQRYEPRNPREVGAAPLRERLDALESDFKKLREQQGLPTSGQDYDTAWSFWMQAALRDEQAFAEREAAAAGRQQDAVGTAPGGRRGRPAPGPTEPIPGRRPTGPEVYEGSLPPEAVPQPEIQRVPGPASPDVLAVRREILSHVQKLRRAFVGSGDALAQRIENEVAPWLARVETGEPMSLADLHTFRVQLDDLARRGYTKVNPSPIEKELIAIRRVVEQEIGAAVDRAAPTIGQDMLAHYQQAKRIYSALAFARSAVNERIAAEEANRFLSAQDWFAGGLGVVAGGLVHPGAIVLGLLTGALSKWSRSHGNQLLAHGLDRVAQVRAIQRMTAETQRRLGAAIAGTLSRAARRISAKKATDAEYQDRVSEARAAMLNRDQTAARVGNATAGLARVAPQTHREVVARALTAADYLARRIPESTPTDTIQPSIAPSLVPQSERDRFMRYARAVDDPGAALDDIAKGHVTPEAIEALRDVYPSLYRQLAEKLTMAAAERTEPLPYQAKVRLAMILGRPTDPTMTPAFVMASQVAALPPEPPKGQGGPGLPKTRQIDNTQDYASRADAIDQRRGRAA